MTVTEIVSLAAAVLSLFYAVRKAWQAGGWKTALGAVIKGVEGLGNNNPAAATLVKNRIRAFSQDLGVEELLHREVKRLTEPQAKPVGGGASPVILAMLGLSLGLGGCATGSAGRSETPVNTRVGWVHCETWTGDLYIGSGIAPGNLGGIPKEVLEAILNAPNAAALLPLVGSFNVVGDVAVKPESVATDSGKATNQVPIDLQVPAGGGALKVPGAAAAALKPPTPAPAPPTPVPAPDPPTPAPTPETPPR